MAAARLLSLLLLFAVAHTSHSTCSCSGHTTTTTTSGGTSGTCGTSKYNPAGVPGGSIPQVTIVGGWVARENEFPWQVQLQLNGGAYCGGSILTPHFVITAAHCTTQPSAQYTVVAGQHRLSSSDANEQFSGVAEIISHTGYNDGNNPADDIALLRLTTPIQFNQNVKPICMPSQPSNNLVGDTVLASGWGTTTSDGSGSNVLLYVTLPTMTLAQCQVCMPVGAGEVCAGVCGGNNGDTCQGDSGGPLVWENDSGAWELIGLTSWGYGCASNTPGSYSDVYYYTDWIDQHVNEQLPYSP